MDMPKVSKCDVQECAYNANSKCHALAITVGDGTHPRCDTFTTASSHGGDKAAVGKVGACKVELCEFNKSLECTARSIQVAHHMGTCADCQTFEPK